MIALLDHRDPVTAAQICALQTASYLVESAIIGYRIPLVDETPDALARASEAFLGYRDGDAIVGALAYETWPGEIEICRLMVHPEHFRRGIASRLLEEITAKAGAMPLRVSTGADNAPAIRLYERFGFSISRRRELPDGLRLVELRRVAGGS